jgi:hypothetical protein
VNAASRGLTACLAAALAVALLFTFSQIKNARTQLAQRLREIRARVRIIISGEHRSEQGQFA